MSAKRSNQKVIQQKYPMLYLIPLIAVLAVIPALLYECDVNTGLTKYNWYTGSQTTIDFFLYVKAIWLYVTFGVMLFLTFYMVFSEEKKISLHKAFMALLVYGGLCLVAACLSVDRASHFGGFMNNMNSLDIVRLCTVDNICVCSFAGGACSQKAASVVCGRYCCFDSVWSVSGIRRGSGCV